MRTNYIVMLILCSCVHGEAQTWNLIWSDEFNGGSINSTYWTYDIGGNGWGNSELEYYTNRLENAKIENGNLLVITREESYGGKDYTSARLKTQDLCSFTYGRIEARIKFPIGQGMWPAFWMLGQNISTVGWPLCGEIDIMEHINQENKIYGTMHWDNNGHVSYGGNVSCEASTYHIYSVEWDSSAIKWFLDGNKYWEGNIAANVNSTEEFHEPFFIILNLAIGGIWPGNPDSTTSFPDTMYVDYVRVYQFSTTAVESGHNQGLSHFSLLQNYPNPFNPSTNISFCLPVKSFVTLRVFDLIGREIVTLVSEELAEGNHSYYWNAMDVPSGVYFYRLQAGSYRETKKLILLR